MKKSKKELYLKLTAAVAVAVGTVLGFNPLLLQAINQFIQSLIN